MSMPEHVHFDGSHLTTVKSNHINKPNRGQSSFHFIHIQSIQKVWIVICRAHSFIAHHHTRMPVPAMTPEIKGVVVSRIIGLCPGDEIYECLLVAKIALAPIGNSVFGCG